MDYIANSLGVSLDEVQTFISVLLAEGLIDEVVVEDLNSCVKCPLRSFCLGCNYAQGLSPSKLKHYRLTEKGLKICDSLRD